MPVKKWDVLRVWFIKENNAKPARFLDTFTPCLIFDWLLAADTFSLPFTIYFSYNTSREAISGSFIRMPIENSYPSFNTDLCATYKVLQISSSHLMDIARF